MIDLANKLVEIEGMKRYYEMVSGTVKALNGVDIEVEEGERIILLGPSGSGKTTLLNCIAALDSPSAGSSRFASKDVPRTPDIVPRWWNPIPPLTGLGRFSRFTEIFRYLNNIPLRILFYPLHYFTYTRPLAKASEDATSFRRENIGYVFQFFNLLQDLTVLENILLIQELAGGRDEKRARELLALVGLEDEVDRFPTEISGGQQQRVAIARSLAKSPKLLLGDELTGNLDTKTSSMVMEVLVKACEAENITTVFVTHDESLTRYATRIIRLDSGVIISDEIV